MSRQTYLIISACIGALKLLLPAFQAQIHLTSGQTDAIVDAMMLVVGGLGAVNSGYNPDGTPASTPYSKSISVINQPECKIAENVDTEPKK